MGNPRITYNSKTIDLRGPNSLIVDTAAPTTITRTLTGVVDTLSLPRVDIHVVIEWRNLDDEALAIQLENFWLWARLGNEWSIALDSAKTVDVALANLEAAGQTVITVDTSTPGTTNGDVYKIIGGPYYHLVTQQSRSGADITITSPTDFDFAAGSKFRDRFFFKGKIVERGGRAPIIYAQSAPQTNLPPKRFDFILDFYEDIV